MRQDLKNLSPPLVIYTLSLVQTIRICRLTQIPYNQ